MVDMLTEVSKSVTDRVRPEAWTTHLKCNRSTSYCSDTVAMAKGVKGKSLKNALARELAAQSEKDRRAAYEKRQLELQKQSAAGGASKKQSAKGKAVQQARQRHAIQPYRDGEAVLLVGEGNFSFARAYAKRFPRSAKVSVATSYDSEKEAKEKYSDLEPILADVSSVQGGAVAVAGQG